MSSTSNYIRHEVSTHPYALPFSGFSPYPRPTAPMMGRPHTTRTTAWSSALSWYAGEIRIAAALSRLRGLLAHAAYFPRHVGEHPPTAGPIYSLALLIRPSTPVMQREDVTVDDATQTMYLVKWKGLQYEEWCVPFMLYGRVRAKCAPEKY